VNQFSKENQMASNRNGVVKMNLKILLSAALLSSTTLLCHSQDQQQAAPAATSAAAPATTQAQTPGNPPIPTAKPAPLAAGKLAESYVIGPTDEISVSVWKEPTVSGAFLVRPDGMITMPLLGDIQAAGFTPTDLGARITAMYTKFLQDPVVNVTVVAIHSKVVFFLGNSNKKGPQEMSPGMTILQAIGSGGLNDDANVKKIYILRDVDGVRTKIPVHYKQALKGDMQYDILLKAGDTIVVP
jgi:polysaccharide export outer membrane protein